ncbi:esterase [Streptomyces sp. NPDC048665]|uniref:esterase n=1 Tax=Streptomyces sp. NPDC048665 TaxID=3155490 RepID=UPI003434A9E7
MILGDLAQRPMLSGVRGAFVRSVPRYATEPIHSTWVSVQDRAPLRPGSVLLHWERAPSGGMDVTARLGLASGDVTLATWPNLHGDWTPIVHPTLLETIGLHATLSVAIDALHLANHLADV